METDPAAALRALSPRGILHGNGALRGRGVDVLRVIAGWLAAGFVLLFLGWLLDLRDLRTRHADASVGGMERASQDERRAGATPLFWTAIASTPVPSAPSTDRTASMEQSPALSAMTGFHFERVIISPVVASFVPEQVIVSDVTGDGRNDIVMTATTFSEIVLRIHPQNEDGTLSIPLEYRFPIYSARGGSLEVVDLDNDGLPEIVMGTESSIVVLKRSGQAFTSQSRAAPIRLLSLGAIDLDGDGHRDVFAQSWGEGAELYFSDGRGGFRGSMPLSTPLAGYNTLEISDFTGDGTPDVVMTNGQGRSRVFIYPGSPLGGLLDKIEIDLPSSQSWPAYGVTVADMNRDGRADLVVSDQGNALSPSRGVHVLYRGADNTFVREEFLQFPGTYQRPGAVQVADLDGNGYPDIVTMMNSYDQMAYILQGPSGFAQPVYHWTEDNGLWTNNFYFDNSFAIGDVNSDGCPDVVLAEASSSLRVFYGRNCLQPARVSSGPMPPRLR